MTQVESPPKAALRQGRSSEESEAGHTVIRLRGEHDASTVDELCETMARAIARDSADLVVDLSDVQFMGAATIDVIVRARNFLRPRSRLVVLRSPSERASRLLELCGLASLIEPAPLDTRSRRGTAGALATCIAFPAVGRGDGAAVPSAREASRIPAPRRDGGGRGKREPAWARGSAPASGHGADGAEPRGP